MALVQIHGRRGAAAATPVRLTNALILADPDLGSEDQEAYPRLADARREAEWLHTRLPDSLLLTGGDVNLDAVTRRTRQRHVVHFAGHGLSYGGFGALVVAGLDRASLVTGDQLAGVDLSAADLVFLAACSTGSGESFGAVNTDSLIHSLLQAGAARVVAARWNVASGPTSRMVSSFYDLLLNGTPTAESLRQTMLSVSRQPGLAHPYYWAGFQVFGAP
jgi:CHAT domain-containing protein